MPEILEALLWCTALATWLMILFVIVSRGWSHFSNGFRRLTKKVSRE